MKTIVGHTAQRAALKELLKKGALPSSLLLAGPSGVGKQLVAKELARLILCTEDGESIIEEDAALFESGSHPDFFAINCMEKEEASVEALRELLYSLHLKSFRGRGRVVLINDCELLSAQASNILLKSIEEPGRQCYFLLLSSNPSKILPTIRSRCQQWFLDRLSDQEVRAILESNDVLLESLPEAASSETLVILADGSMQNLQELADHTDRFEQLKQSLAQVFCGDAAAAFVLAKDVAGDKASLREMLHLLRIISRNAMKESREPDETARWARCVENLIDAERYIFERNLSAQHVLYKIFLGLSDTNTSDTTLCSDIESDLIRHCIV